MSVQHWLASFPRTGSHWLRLAMRLYLGREEAVFEHTHDLDLTLEAEDVVYLWRQDAASVVYSQIVYEQLLMDDRSIRDVAIAYGRHLRHWLRPEAAAVVVTYERMQAELERVLVDLAAHLQAEPAPGGLSLALGVERSHVAASSNDPRVISHDPRYDEHRELFRRRHGPMIDRLLAIEGP